MLPASLESTLQEERSVDEHRLFDGLRSVQWRVNLGILPSSSSASIDDIRRVTADCRRRYASLRRRLLVDPHVLKVGSNSPDLVIDNPLSQNPDSPWSRFFQSAELEKLVDQDLSRLYPEHGNIFQVAACQGTLRRILLLWCLRHPEYGYRQGMHELLAPLLYVLHVDVEHLYKVRKLYKDHFTDKFDGMSSFESTNTYSFDIKSSPNSIEDECSPANVKKVRSLHELDTEIQTVALLSDAYGAEGELGVLLSEKFMEHDAYCMFDALMTGSNGVVAMADFFSSSPIGGSQRNIPPVIEASASLYYVLSVVDSSMHSHLVELGVEPQYFSLRWFRVLFGREFSLGDLLLIWDEIFASDNKELENHSKGADEGFRVLCSHRGAFIAGMAVSMILYMRSSLLAAETATSCLQRLLNFPENADLKKLIEKAKSLQALALDSNVPLSSIPSVLMDHNHSKSTYARSHSFSFDFGALKTPCYRVPMSYWEEKWRDLHKAEDINQATSRNKVPTEGRGWVEKVKMRLSRSSVRQQLLEHLSQVLVSEDKNEKASSHEDVTWEDQNKDHIITDAGVRGQDGASTSGTSSVEERWMKGNHGSEEISIYADLASRLSAGSDNENDSEKSGTATSLCRDNDNDSEKSDVASSLSPDESDEHQDSMEGSTLPVSTLPEDYTLNPQYDNHYTKKPATGMKERKLLSSKFRWIWKFGRKAGGEGTSEKCGRAPDAMNTIDNENNQHNTSNPSLAVTSRKSSLSSRGDAGEQKVMGPLKNLGQSMLEQIQVIESAFQQDRSQISPLENFSKNVIVSKGQVTAVAALKELRKISNVLSEL